MTSLTSSLRERLLTLGRDERRAILDTMTSSELNALQYDWRFWARGNQLPPDGDWTTWLVMAGRGFGKTRTGAEWIKMQVEAHNPQFQRIALVGRTSADVRKTMIEGESGILSVSNPEFMPVYKSTQRELRWPNGFMATTYTGEEPDQLRGPQHGAAWADEAAAWKYPDAWDQLQFGLRLGSHPQQIVTTTPRPVRVIRDLIKRYKTELERFQKNKRYGLPSVAITTGSSYENRDNLASSFFDTIISKYEGTRLGQQELQGILLEDIPGALWVRKMFDERRRNPDLLKCVVAIDPSIAAEGSAAECGIVVVGKGTDGHGYVMRDATLRGSPGDWASKAVTMFDTFKCDRIIAESNQGGAMVEHLIHTVDPHIPVTLVHASRGKVARAEPVAALYEQGKVWHTGVFDDLEDQLCTWTPEDGESPDRLDALVWGLTYLFLELEERKPYTIFAQGIAHGWSPLDNPRLADSPHTRLVGSRRR